MPDSKNPQAWNRYAYGLNNPVRFTDPSGHFTQEELATLLGFENWKALEGSDLWKNWNQEWRDMLLSEHAQLGSMLVGSHDGQNWIYKAMFVMRPENGRLALWNSTPFNLGTNMDIEDVAQTPYFAVFSPVDQPGGSYYLPPAVDSAGHRSRNWTPSDKAWPILANDWKGPFFPVGEYIAFTPEFNAGNTLTFGADVIGLLYGNRNGFSKANAFERILSVLSGGDIMRQLAYNGFVDRLIPVVMDPNPYSSSRRLPLQYFNTGP